MIILIFLTSIILVGLDTFYINIIKNRFSKQIEDIQGTPMSINIFGFIMTYIFLITSIYYFIIMKNENYKNAFILGLIIYGVFDMSNLALFKKWSLFLSFIDIIWGGILFALTTIIVNILKKIIKIKS